MKLEGLSRRCLDCNSNHNTLYYHYDRYKTAFKYCNKCGGSRDLDEYCAEHGIDVPTEEQINRIITSDSSNDKELEVMSWPKHFIPLWQDQAKPGIEYLKSRGIEPSDGMYFDVEQNGIVFPYYHGSSCVGAQVRFIEPQIKDGKPWKITTVKGTKLTKLFYGWNQGDLPHYVKNLVVTEGAFNAIALQQTFNHHFKSATKNPYRFVAASGSSLGKYRKEILSELKAEGIRVILAADSDEAGLAMFQDACEAECITHWSTVSKDGVDWNDVLIEGGEKELLAEFLKNLKKA